MRVKHKATGLEYEVRATDGWESEAGHIFARSYHDLHAQGLAPYSTTNYYLEEPLTDFEILEE